MNRYARRVDANHAPIVRALEAIGVGVIDCSGMGNGFPDLLTAQRGTLRLVEVKNGDRSPSARKLTVFQVRLHDMLRRHGGTVHVVTSVDEALALHGAR